MSPYVSQQLHTACTEMENRVNMITYKIQEGVDEMETSKDLMESTNGYKDDYNNNEIFQKEQSECHKFLVKWSRKQNVL